MSSGGDQPPQPQVQPQVSDSHSHTPDYAPYPKLDPNDVAPPPVATESRATDAATTMPAESNPYVSPAPVPAPTSAKSNLSLSLSLSLSPPTFFIFISCFSIKLVIFFNSMQIL